MKSYKSKLFNSYLDTHIRNRKGIPTLKHYEFYSKYFSIITKKITLSKNSRILDLGCGVGFFLNSLKNSKYSNLTGIEFSSELVNIAVENGLDFVKQGDILNELNNTFEKYDLIILKDVIEHFDKDMIYEILEKLNKKLNTGGKVFIQVPNATNLFSGRVLYNDFTHEFSFTKTSLTQLLSSVGFKNLRFFKNEPYLYSLTPKHFIKFILKSIYHALIKILFFFEEPSFPIIVSESIIVIAEKNGD